MKNITEKFNDRLSISQMIDQHEMEANMDESLKDVFDTVKTKFKQAWQWLKGIVVKVGTYILPVSNDGTILPAITPMTSGAAYKEGFAKDDFTFVVNSKDASKISGLRTDPKGALALGSVKGNSFDFWSELFESESGDKANVNEVKMHTEDPEAKWNIIEDDAELRDEIVRHMKKGNLARLLIWGAPGIGKTAILNDIVEGYRKAGNDFNLIVKTLSNETPDNFMLPKYVEVAEGNVKAEDVPKTWLPVYHPTGDPAKDAELDAALGRGMLFIDELSRATQQVLNVCLPLINEGQFNGWKMGSGWCIVCASNRPEDEDSGQSPLGNAMMNRFAHVYYEPTVHSWRKWADNQGFISPLLLQWLSLPATENMSGAKYYYMDPNEEYQNASSTALMCTPRAWTNAMRELATFAHTGTLEGFTIFDIPRRILGRVLNKYIPTSAVDSFIAFLDVIHKIGDFERVTTDIWKNGGGNVKISAKDLNLVTLPLAQLVISSHADELPTSKEFENLMTWLVAMNSDQLTSYVLDVFKNVFLSDVKDETSREQVFVIKAIYNRISKDEQKLSLYNSLYKSFFSRWGIDWDSAPDYQPGLMIANKKFGEVFRNSKVDGKDALG